MTVTKSGKVTLKKKAKKGTYKIRITAAKTSKYQKAVKYVTVKVKIMIAKRNIQQYVNISFFSMITQVFIYLLPFYILFHNQIQALRRSISQSKLLLCSHLLFSHLLCFRLVNVPHLQDGSPAHSQNFLSHMLLRWYFPHKLQNLLSPEPEISLKLIKYKYIQERAT